MYCHKCGTKLGDDAVFCYKCGTKTVDPVIEHQTLGAGSIETQDTAIQDDSEMKNQPVLVEQRKAVQGSEFVYDKNKDDFITFVNNYVRQVTPYQSAEELLESSESKFAWWCFGISFLIVCFLFYGATGWPAFVKVICIIFFGYMLGMVSTLVIDKIKTQLFKKTIVEYNRISNKIDVDDLLRFLNDHLKYLPLLSNEWGYVKMVGYSVKGVIFAGVLNSVTSISGAARIGSRFGKKHIYIEIWIEPDKTSKNSNSTMYYFTTGRSSSAIWSSESECMTKAVPILKAAMKYYLMYRSVEEN